MKMGQIFALAFQCPGEGSVGAAGECLEFSGIANTPRPRPLSANQKT